MFSRVTQTKPQSSRFCNRPTPEFQNFFRQLATAAAIEPSQDYQPGFPKYKTIEKSFHFSRKNAFLFFTELLEIFLEALPHCTQMSLTLKDRILVCIPTQEVACWMLKNCQESRTTLKLLDKLAELAGQEKKCDLAFLIKMEVPDMQGSFNVSLDNLLKEYAVYEVNNNTSDCRIMTR